MNVLTDSVRRVADRYAAAVLERNVDEFMRNYAQEVRVFDTWRRAAYEGASEWRKMADDWFGSLGTDTVIVTFEELHVTGTLELAMATALVGYEGRSAEGDKLKAMQNRLTWVLARTGDTYKIIHEHTSVPATFGA